MCILKEKESWDIFYLRRKRKIHVMYCSHYQRFKGQYIQQFPNLDLYVQHLGNCSSRYHGLGFDNSAHNLYIILTYYWVFILTYTLLLPSLITCWLEGPSVFCRWTSIRSSELLQLRSTSVPIRIKSSLAYLIQTPVQSSVRKFGTHRGDE